VNAVDVADLESATAEEVIAYAVERFHPRLTMACSFQKEESVLVHMLTQLTDSPRVFTIDTGVLFPETLTTWKAFEDRFGLKVEVFDARSPDEPWTADRCCSAARWTRWSRRWRATWTPGSPGSGASRP
jgi:phosphoadenosine phosphosulfate reductase